MAPEPTISPLEAHVVVAISGLQSVISAHNLAEANWQARIEKLLERIAVAVEHQTVLMARGNGHDHEPLSSTT